MDKSEREKLAAEVEDVIRASENRIYSKGGMEAIVKYKLDLRTCKGCGYVCDDEVRATICPICNRDILDDLDEIEAKLRAKLYRNNPGEDKQ